MAEPLINTPTGAPRAPAETSRLRDVSRPPAVPPRPAAAPFVAAPPPSTTTSSVAPDVLLAAHQARDINRSPAFDARFANAASTYRQGTEDQNKPAPQGDAGGGAEILAFDPQNTSGRPLRKTAPAPSTPVIIDQVDFSFTSSSSRNGTSAAPSSGATAPRPRQDFARANQAYVQAGAADGLTYSARGFDTSTLLFDHAAFNIVV